MPRTSAVRARRMIVRSSRHGRFPSRKDGEEAPRLGTEHDDRLPRGRAERSLGHPAPDLQRAEGVQAGGEGEDLLGRQVALAHLAEARQSALGMAAGPGELRLDRCRQDDLALVPRAAEVAVGQGLALARVGEGLRAREGLRAGLDDEVPGVRCDDGAGDDHREAALVVDDPAEAAESQQDVALERQARGSRHGRRLGLRAAEDHGGVDLALAARGQRDPQVAGHAHDAPAACPVHADDLQHVGPGAVQRLALAGVGADREHPPGAAVTEAGGVHAERGPPAADDLPRRSDGEGDVVAGGDDRDGRALPRARRRRGRHRPRCRGSSCREGGSSARGGRPAEVAPGIQPRHEGREGGRRPGDGDAGGVAHPPADLEPSRRAPTPPTTSRLPSRRRRCRRRAPGRRRAARRGATAVRRRRPDGAGGSRAHGRRRPATAKGPGTMSPTPPVVRWCRAAAGQRSVPVRPASG